MKTKPLKAVVATRYFVAVAPPPEGATPAHADTISSSLISATAVALARLGTVPVLRVLTPVVFMWGFGWGGFSDPGAAGAALWVVEFRLTPLAAQTR